MFRRLESGALYLVLGLGTIASAAVSQASAIHNVVIGIAIEAIVSAATPLHFLGLMYLGKNIIPTLTIVRVGVGHDIDQEIYLHSQSLAFRATLDSNASVADTAGHGGD